MSQIHGLGRVSSPLAVVEIGGETKLVVHPAAAIGTDVIGLTLAMALFFSTKSVFLRVLAVGGAAWMSTAMVKEIAKLFAGPEQKISVEPISEGVMAGTRRFRQEELLPSGLPATWTAEFVVHPEKRMEGLRPSVVFIR